MWAVDVLKEEGVVYDSNIFPVSLHYRYVFAGRGVLPFRWPNDLLEIPLAVYKFRNLSLPVGRGQRILQTVFLCFLQIYLAVPECHAATIGLLSASVGTRPGTTTAVSPAAIRFSPLRQSARN